MTDACAARTDEKSDDIARRQHVATVSGVVIAGVLASYVVPGPYSWGSTLIGIILAFILIGYGEWPAGRREAFGFAAAAAFVTLLTLGVLLDELWNISGWDSDWKPDDVQQYRSDGLDSAKAWLAFFGCWLVVLAVRAGWDERQGKAKTAAQKRPDGQDAPPVSKQ